MSDTLFCYHCRAYHAKADMRQIATRGAKRWRCIRSIEATKQGSERRAAFGREQTALNKAMAQARLRILANPELRNLGK